MYIRQLKQVKADNPLSSRYRVKLQATWNCRLIMRNHGNTV